MLVLLLTAALAGTPSYRLTTDGEQTQQIVDDAVEKATHAFPRLFHAIVRRKLAKVPTVCETYAFRVDDDVVAWQCDDRKELVVARADLGESFEIRHEGKKYATTITLADDGAVIARFEGDDGGRTNRFVRSADGSTLTLTAVVDSPKMYEPLVWELVYRRAEE